MAVEKNAKVFIGLNVWITMAISLKQTTNYND